MLEVFFGTVCGGGSSLFRHLFPFVLVAAEKRLQPRDFCKSEAGSRALIKLNCSGVVRRKPVAKGEGGGSGPAGWPALFSAPFPPRRSRPRRCIAHRLERQDWRAFPGDVPGGGVRQGLASAQGRGKGGRS